MAKNRLDLKTRLKRLGETHTADRSTGTELPESNSKPTAEPSYPLLATAEPTGRLDDDRGHPAQQSDMQPGIGGGGWEDEESPPLTYMEMLAPGLEVGPPNHRFRLERQLGEDDKSRVWLAIELSSRHSNAPKKALKFFAPSLRDSPYLAKLIRTQADKAAQRMELLNFRPLLVIIRAKATLAALIDHPNIAKVYGWRYGEDGWPFVEMEYLSGRNLRDWRNQEKAKTSSWISILPLIRAIATALDHAHRDYRLPHRHLKLENVFITEQGVVKVLDFGLLYQPPRAVARKMQETKSGSRSTLPAPPYPQLLQQLRFKPDICALAALTYELLTGNPPYHGRNVVEQDLDTIPLVVTQPPSLSNTLLKPDELTDQAWRVLLPCLRYQLEACPDSAGDWLARLQAAQHPALRKRRSTGKQGWSILLAAAMALTGLYLILSTPASPWLEALQGLFRHSVQPLQHGKAKTPPAVSDEQAFTAATAADTINAYQAYLQHCSVCAHRHEAETAIQRLQAQLQRTNLLARFNTYLQARELAGKPGDNNNALAVLQELAAVDPQDAFIAKGKRQLALAYAEMARESLTQHNYSAARSHLAQGEKIMTGLKELTGLAQEINAAETGEHDAATYAQAQRLNTRAAYQTYLANCEPTCGHRQEAQAALQQLLAAPAPADSRVFRDQLAGGGQGPEMVRISAGTFAMGSPPVETGRLRDEAIHQVRIGKAFAIGRYEVTFEEYDRFAAATGHPKPADQGWGRERRPVILVSRQDALAYTDWLSSQTGQRYRLPTEAEWEYAARAGTSTARYWGNNPNQGCDYANAADLKGQTLFTGWTAMQCQDNYIYTASVGSYQPNAFGLYDMLGNVLEWTCSAYDEAYQGGEQTCAGPAVTVPVVARGGSWSDEPAGVRAADRYKVDPQSQEYYLGFRVARDL
ncbi:MAG: SUMF1/EgtB/PvdO family nonheme iron enzyme [Candidatus Competibacteraceae bacterium]